MPKYSEDVAKLVHELTGQEIKPGEHVIGFRDGTYRFDYVSKLPGGPSGGKVVASVPCGHGPEDDHGYFCLEDGWAQHEYSPSVLDGRIEIQK